MVVLLLHEYKSKFCQNPNVSCCICKILNYRTETIGARRADMRGRGLDAIVIALQKRVSAREKNEKKTHHITQREIWNRKRKKLIFCVQLGVQLGNRCLLSNAEFMSILHPGYETSPTLYYNITGIGFEREGRGRYIETAITQNHWSTALAQTLLGI